MEREVVVNFLSPPRIDRAIPNGCITRTTLRQKSSVRRGKIPWIPGSVWPGGMFSRTACICIQWLLYFRSHILILKKKNKLVYDMDTVMLDRIRLTEAVKAPCSLPSRWEFTLKCHPRQARTFTASMATNSNQHFLSGFCPQTMELKGLLSFTFQTFRKKANNGLWFLTRSGVCSKIMSLKRWVSY